ncbi:MAG: OmpA family protein [Desulforhopalus sp.]
MIKMKSVFPCCLLWLAVLLLLSFLYGCGAMPTETRYQDNIRRYTSSPQEVKYTTGMHDGVTAYYTLREGGSKGDKPKRQPEGKQSVETTGPPEMALVLEVSDVLFEFDRSVIKEPYMPELNQWADYLDDNPQVTAEIYGYTDSIGTAAYNQGLSERRAQAVVNYLVGKGVDPGRLQAKGFGENNPVDTNDTREGRQKNRRVELKL